MSPSSFCSLTPLALPAPNLCVKALLEDHGRQKEMREKRERERREKELRRLADLEAARSEESKRPGFQRLRAQQVGVVVPPHSCVHKPVQSTCLGSCL